MSLFLSVTGEHTHYTAVVVSRASAAVEDLAFEESEKREKSDDGEGEGQR